MKKLKKGSKRSLNKTRKLIIKECKAVRDLLLEKNQSYGNSFSKPIRIFAADLDADSQLRTRIDDKLARIKSGNNYRNEDTIVDIIGYLILLRLLHRKTRKKK